jgi:hypothetical protein
MSDEGAVENMVLPGMPAAVEPGGKFHEVQETVTRALAATRDRLRELRKQREEINAEIKHLVDEEELLERMSKVKKKPT